MMEPLTTEKIRKKFKNNFDLCNFAIQIARGEITEGESAELKQVLEEVQKRVKT